VPADIFQGDYGDWWVGLHDNAAGAFPTRECAQAVAARREVAA
jgi:hypothetical protein